jgi:hypothetical protein
MATCLQYPPLQNRTGVHGSKTADGGLVKQSRQVGRGWSWSSGVEGNGAIWASGEDDEDADSESDAESSSGTVVRSD